MVKTTIKFVHMFFGSQPFILQGTRYKKGQKGNVISAFQINKGWHYAVQFERCFLLCLYECLHICIHIYVEMSMVKTTIKFVDMIFGSQPSIL